MRPQPGETLGHYQISERLGSGGNGEVYRATDLHLMRDVALKVLRTEAGANPAEFARLQREARVASALNHPNIVTIHDVGVEGPTPYIAMELVQGMTLRKFLEHGPPKPDPLLRIGEQIANGLATAHEAGVVHRDLKPENLMLTEDGLVKILDFGLARSFGGFSNRSGAWSTPATTSQSFAGTIAYMSPEQVRGRPVDYRSDQFTLGIILYEMATGSRPFQRATIFETLTAIAEEQHEALSRFGLRMPLRLSLLVDKCLSKDPERRYPSTRELAQKISEIRNDVAKKPPERKEGPVIAVLPFADISPDSSRRYFCQGLTEEIRAQLQSVAAVGLLSRFAIPHDRVGSIRDIVAETGADNLVEGSVRICLDRVRIAAELIDTVSGQSLWSGQYDRKLHSSLRIQTDVARRVVRAILPILCQAD